MPWSYGSISGYRPSGNLTCLRRSGRPVFHPPALSADGSPLMLSLLTGQAGGARRRPQHIPEHRGREAAGEGVALADVEAAEEPSPPPSVTRAACAKAGRGRGTLQPAASSAGSAACQPNAPSTTTARSVGLSSSSSLTSHGRQVSRSSGVGLLAGGAQCTGEVMRTPYSSSPSSTLTAVACDASPTSCSAAYSTSPERSPVNIRPVRFPPWAAGASPTISSRASAGPNPGTGRPQYVQSAKRGPLGTGDLLPPLDQPGQARHPAIRASSPVSPVRPAAGSLVSIRPR